MEKADVKIIADSTCDLTEELLEKYDIAIVPLCIVMDDKSYYDRTEVTPEEIFRWSEEHKTTPKTAAISMEKALEAAGPYIKKGRDVIFIGISEEMSTTCNVMRLAAAELETDRLFVIDSRSLSTGIGLQVLRAAELAKTGMPAEEILKIIDETKDKVRASFVVDTLTYLARGGRCTAATALLANTLKLKPRIEVKDGKMGVEKKYRGTLDKVILKYTKDMEEDLLRADGKRVFITHSGCDGAVVEQVRTYLEGLGKFQEIVETRAGGVISSHCGPGTLGVLFFLE
ncbi:DegV family protein [Qiania dongpingensis]|uniref:DegV family protein n=1 Tax=Qiania dongpingensis TaxID=2763669 RepID=A0A7G9G3N9_9FIRM|nr:DegV family protein [Qiania dongpingensis]QNM05421.1 DegV family protein [Qiania dongpingensis]